MRGVVTNLWLLARRYGERMNDVKDWINLGMLIIASAAAGFAWWQAAEARKSRSGAETALASAERAASASERQAAAAERALELQEQLLEPAPWSTRFVSGDTYACINNSNRVMLLTSLSAMPRGSSVYWSHVAEDHRYQPGDRFEFMFSFQDPNRPHKIVIEWKYEGENDTRTWTLAL